MDAPTDTVIDYGHAADADTLVTAEQAAKIADVSARTVRRWIASKEIASEDGPTGRLVSASEVRLRAARGHVRPRPPMSAPMLSSTTRTDTDGQMSVASVVSDALSERLDPLFDRVERLTREAMAEKARADALQAEKDRLEMQLEEMAAELLALQMDTVRPSVSVTADSTPAPEAAHASAPSPERGDTVETGAGHHPLVTAPQSGQKRRSWWQRLTGG